MDWKNILKQSKSNLFDANQFAHHKNHPKFSRFEAALNDANTAHISYLKSPWNESHLEAGSKAFKEAHKF